MLKKTIKFVDYDGNQRNEEFYFNLNKAEILQMELSEVGGLEQMINKVVAEQDTKKLIEIFKDLILKSYGVKSPDGKRFVKSEELSNEFSQTEAFVDLFMELAMDAKAASEFVNGVIPQSLEK